MRKFCATGERGIDHEEAQSNKTAERLGLLGIEVQAFLFVLRQKTLSDCVHRPSSRCEGVRIRASGLGCPRLVMLWFLDPAYVACDNRGKEQS
jgi:hypothetical protein